MATPIQGQVGATEESKSPCIQKGISLPEKTSWPELVGATGKTAKETIEKENPSLVVIIMPPGAPWTADWVSNRVRIAVDSNGIVTQVPTIG